eukprot:CAMPEP_0180397320 /NCGR_PEP_ID=MMETSP0989-20121125/35962_1 /TAXON_ID=697907 /ORGANISM="non described non described, Strain CCMP2293" /LENGTH=144 /DNA_ID=CAMNT_0022399747 /DNA_START=308 /DNA_END=739 /DNA_ORIENTATION=+
MILEIGDRSVRGLERGGERVLGGVELDELARDRFRALEVQRVGALDPFELRENVGVLLVDARELLLELVLLLPKGDAMRMVFCRRTPFRNDFVGCLVRVEKSCEVLALALILPSSLGVLAARTLRGSAAAYQEVRARSPPLFNL